MKVMQCRDSKTLQILINVCVLVLTLMDAKDSDELLRVWVDFQSKVEFRGSKQDAIDELSALLKFLTHLQANPSLLAEGSLSFKSIVHG